MKVWRGACLVLLAALAVAGCSTVRKVLGVADQPEPSVNIRAAEARWLLIKNPRFGDVASEPEYIWVEEDKVPVTFTTLVRGQRAIIAPPEIVANAPVLVLPGTMSRPATHDADSVPTTFTLVPVTVIAPPDTRPSDSASVSSLAAPMI